MSHSESLGSHFDQKFIQKKASISPEERFFGERILKAGGELIGLKGSVGMKGSAPIDPPPGLGFGEKSLKFETPSDSEPFDHSEKKESSKEKTGGVPKSKSGVWKGSRSGSEVWNQRKGTPGSGIFGPKKESLRPESDSSSTHTGLIFF